MLELTPDEVESYTVQLGCLLEHFKAIQELGLSGVEPTNNAGANENVLRDDVAGAPLPREKVVGQCPAADGKNFVVPAIIGPEE